jgi:uncharacterized protein with von Willebrand factor type A (vWA) domain
VLIDFFLSLKESGLPVSVKEYLNLCEAMQKGLAYGSVDDFYYLCRTCLIKDEANYDRFDRAFAHFFKGVENLDAALTKLFEKDIPDEWLKKLAEKMLSDEEKAQVEALGGWGKLMETLRQRLEEQKGRHQGGNKWIGTAGTSPFGSYGFNPEGIRIGQDKSRNKSAVKVWDQREYRDYDSQVELGIRNIQMALRRLRKFARSGAEEELDLDHTIKATASNAGYLDIKMVPERHNRVKVLLFLDVGGSMDEYIHRCEELFSAAKTEFKHLEYFYFHNFFYESVWRNNRLRHSEKFSTWDVLNKYGKDYKLIIVGDATMSPYEILQPGGSVEHWNEEAGSVWLQRLLAMYNHAAWINPTQEAHWQWTHSVTITRQLMGDRMYPMTVEGLDRAMKALL